METEQLIKHDSYFGYAGELLNLRFDILILRHDSMKVVLDKLPNLKPSVTRQVFFTASAIHIIKTEVT